MIILEIIGRLIVATVCLAGVVVPILLVIGLVLFAINKIYLRLKKLL